MFDVAIIGGGPVGIFSIFSCGIEGLKCAIIDSLPILGGQCNSLYKEKYIYDIPGFKKIKGKDLISNLIEQSSIFDPSIFLNETVDEILKIENYFLLKFKSGKEIHAKSILITLGAGIFAPFKPPLEDIDLLENRSVFYQVLNKELFKNKTITILGAGDSALDWAQELVEVAKKVNLVHRRDYIKGSSYSFEKILNASNIQIKIPYIVEKLNHNDGILYSINISNNGKTEELETDFLIPCLGLKMQLSFLSKWNLNLKNNKILVNQSNMKTSQEGIFAAGDCVYYENKRNLILTGFAESMQSSVAIFKYLYPETIGKIAHSTNMEIFNLK